jgi:methyl-accepting chemotaxis protein
MRSSLLATAAVALVVAIAVGVVGILRMNAISDRAQAIYHEALLPLAAVEDIQQLIWHSRWASLSNLTATDPAKAAAYAEETSATLDLIAVRLSDYQKLPVGRQERASMQTFETAWANYLDLRAQSSALKKAGKIAEWQDFRSGKLNPSINQAVTNLDALKKLSQEHAAASAAAAQSAAERARLVIGLVLAAGILLAAAFSILIARTLSRRLSELGEVLAAMAEGDLTEREPDSAANEIGQMSRSVHRAAAQTRAAVRTLAETSSGLSGRSEELQQASRSLAGNTAQTSHRIGSIEAAAGEVTAGVQAVAGGAEEMGAARAGETGKGFAVVAGEVKDLAQETAKATEEIGRRIEAIQADARVAVESISGIGQVIVRINDYQQTIASAVEEQSATTNGMTNDLNRAAGGTSQISGQLAEVVEVTASTRVAAQATETAATDLARISDELRTTVDAFRY